MTGPALASVLILLSRGPRLSLFENKEAAMDFLLGTWKGETKTWFEPSAKPEMGTIETHFQKIIGDLFIEEFYTGTIGDKAHEGRRIFGTDKRVNETTCYWMDTFHTGATAMHCHGPFAEKIISVEGDYFGGEEKWGWRIEFRSLSLDKIEMKHFNIWPNGKADLAIECTLNRV
ncbi:MAG: DUF1579 domain-containing protein [Proteobacteria bacterium]|nr:MAG: DUF1579 domain-containing protein [Pseudomonadota bacterium]